MGISFVREFLRQRLIQGLDEADYERLATATEGTKSRLEDDYLTLRRYCAALLDEKLPDADPTLDEIQRDVEEVWRTFPGKYPTRPAAVLRAVGLQALADIAAKDEPSVKPILWLTGSTLVEHMPLGRDREILIPLMTQWGEAVEELAVREWQDTEAFNTNTHIPFDKTAMAKLGADAFGVDENSAVTAVHLAPVMLKITQGLSNLVNHNASQLSQSLAQALTDGLSRIAVSQKRRTDLLWWKQTLYSQSLQTSYRDIQSPAVQAFALAYDLHLQLPSVYPQSIEYLLRETAKELFGELGSWRTSPCAFATEVVSHPAVAKTLAEFQPTSVGRVAFLEFLAAASQNQAELDAAKLRVGLPDDLELSGGDISVWVLRELTAHALSVFDEEHEE